LLLFLSFPPPRVLPFHYTHFPQKRVTGTRLRVRA
jgi:hypothetical protein